MECNPSGHRNRAIVKLQRIFREGQGGGGGHTCSTCSNCSACVSLTHGMQLCMLHPRCVNFITFDDWNVCLYGFMCLHTGLLGAWNRLEKCTP